MAQLVYQNVTIADLLRLALPLNTIVLNEVEYRARVVNWMVVVADWATLAEQVEGDDLVVLRPGLMGSAQEEVIIRGMGVIAERMCAGILLFDSVSPSIIQQATEYQLPLLLAPNGATMREMQQNVMALLLDRQRQMSERAMQLYRKLSEMSREGQGLEAMAEAMSQLTGKIILVQDKRLDFPATCYPPSSSIDRVALEQFIGHRDNLPPILRNRKATARTSQTYWQQILPLQTDTGQNVARLISPIISGDRARGYVSIVGLADELDLLDTLAVEHGAAACALEMAKAKAVSEVKKALRGDFLEGVLAGTLPAKEIDRLESRLDHDTKQLHAVLTFSWNSPNAPSLRRLSTTINWVLTTHKRPALVYSYADDHVCVFQALKGSDMENLNTAQELGRRVREQLEIEFPGVALVVGMSGPAGTLADWPTVYQEAVQAMRMGQRLKLNQLVDFHSLGIYQLLGQIENIPVVRDFCDQVIGPLIRYDAEHNSSLVQTMQAYFAHHGNISQTAESLFIHRNTLLYRLERVEELTRQNLDQADMRLAMHLALKRWELRSEAGVRSER